MTARVFDCFMFMGELDMLECRLTELADAVDAFVIVECAETHSGRPKPFYFLEHEHRFQPWASRIAYSTVAHLEASDPMLRDEEQREAFRGALQGLARPEDIILQSDLDEIPTRSAISVIERQLWDAADRSNFLAFEQRLHCFAVDWEHPQKWRGTVAARYAHIKSFSEMRHCRETVPRLSDAGHHLSWLGGGQAAAKKVEAFAHQELLYLRDELARDYRRESGLHVDGVQMRPVDIDPSYPSYIRDGKCPDSWFRPR